MSSASEDSQLNITLHSGALVYLQLNQSAEDKDDKEPRILFADGFTHSDVRAAPEKHFSFPNALFRVLPKLSYEAQGPGSRPQDREREKASNRAIRTAPPIPLNYDRTVQLEHLRSGKFLTVEPREGARLDNECLKVHLVDGGKKESWLQLKPSMKARTAGSEVFYNEELHLAVTTPEGAPALLHASERQFDEDFDPSGKWREINALEARDSLGSSSHPGNTNISIRLFCARPKAQELQLG